MNSEGKGMHAPKPVPVILSPSDLILIEAITRDRAHKYRGPGSVWRAGLIPEMSIAPGRSMDRAETPIMIGLGGECAVKLFIESRVGKRAMLDYGYKEFGDGGKDVEIAGLGIQIKAKVRESGKNLIKQSEGRRIFTLCGDCHCFALWPGLPNNRVLLLGWAWNRMIKTLPPEKGLGDWMNYRVPDEQLSPMTALISEIKWRTEAA